MVQPYCVIARSPAIWLYNCTQSCNLIAPSLPRQGECQTLRHSNGFSARPHDTPVPECQTLRHSSAKNRSTFLCQTLRHSSARVPDTQTLKCQTLRHSTGFSDRHPSPTVTNLRHSNKTSDNPLSLKHNPWRSPVTHSDNVKGPSLKVTKPPNLRQGECQTPKHFITWVPALKKNLKILWAHDHSIVGQPFIKTQIEAIVYQTM